MYTFLKWLKAAKNPLLKYSLIKFDSNVKGNSHPALRQFIKIQTNGTSSDNDWQQLTTSVQRMATNAASDNEWQQVV